MRLRRNIPPKRGKSGRFENHRRYLDIQMLVSGEEQIDVCLSHAPLPDGEYCGAEDIEFSPLEENYVTIPLRPGEFLVFFPANGIGRV